MATDKLPLVQRVETSCRTLAAVANELNAASDDLGSSVTRVDDALKKLNLGITAWVEVRAASSQDGLSWHKDEIGFAKLGSRWGIALKVSDGTEEYPEEDQVESWLFNDAPRALRLAALDKLPDLLNKLSVEAAATTTTIQRKLTDFKQVADAVLRVVGEKS